MEHEILRLQRVHTKPRRSEYVRLSTNPFINTTQYTYTNLKHGRNFSGSMKLWQLHSTVLHSRL